MLVFITVVINNCLKLLHTSAAKGNDVNEQKVGCSLLDSFAKEQVPNVGTDKSFFMNFVIEKYDATEAA